MKNTIKIILFALLIITLASCSPSSNQGKSDQSPINLKGIQAEFRAEIPYDKKERTQLDLFMPKSEKPTPLVIYIHGGGFVRGDKDFAYGVRKKGRWDFPEEIRTLLNQGIAFASVRYSLLEEGERVGIKKPMMDVKRALQYLRSRADEFHIDKNKIVLTGSSAGAGTALWIGLKDDMKESSSSDPVLRESTRVQGVVARNTQATYDLDRWGQDVFADFHLDMKELALEHENFEKTVTQFYGIEDMGDYNSKATNQYKKAVDMLALMDEKDPPLWVNNTLFGNGDPGSSKSKINHHPFHARILQERGDQVGLPVVAYYGKPILFADESGETWVEFCIRILKG